MPFKHRHLTATFRDRRNDKIQVTDAMFSISLINPTADGLPLCSLTIHLDPRPTNGSTFFDREETYITLRTPTAKVFEGTVDELRSSFDKAKEQKEKTWTQAFCLAITVGIREGADVSPMGRTCRAAGLTWDQINEAEVDEFDLEILRKYSVELGLGEAKDEEEIDG